MRHPETNCFTCLHLNVCIMVGRLESLGYCEIWRQFLGANRTQCWPLSPQASQTTRPGVPHTNFSLMPSLRGPGLRAVGDQTSPTDVAPAALPQHNRTLLDTRCHHTMGCRPLTSGGDHLSHKEPHMTSSQTPLTQMSLVPTSTASVTSTLAKSTMLKIKSFQDLTFRLSGKVLDGGPCTPFDPAPFGLALHEAQGEELVSTPVFITAGLKRTIRTNNDND